MIWFFKFIRSPIQANDFITKSCLNSIRFIRTRFLSFLDIERYTNFICVVCVLAKGKSRLIYVKTLCEFRKG